MDEDYVARCFSEKVLSVKLIRNKQTGQLKGYGFIEFSNRAAAERVLQSYTGQLMPNTQQLFRLNWASLGAGECRGDDDTDYTIFVGNFSTDVIDYVLQGAFWPYYWMGRVAASAGGWVGVTTVRSTRVAALTWEVADPPIS